MPGVVEWALPPIPGGTITLSGCGGVRSSSLVLETRDPQFKSALPDIFELT